MTKKTDLFSSETCSGVNRVATNVGSISDFLFPSTNGETNFSVNKEKIGHRRVDETGHVSYKRILVDELIKSLQIAVRHVIGQVHQPQRQVLLQDFQQIEYQNFPSDGSNSTPKHPYEEFRLKTYAPIAFRFFRNAFGLDPSAFLSSLCGEDLCELANPGASGSLFYMTADDLYIIKTVSKKEARFLLSLLPAYYLNLTQNPFTLLPKFFGLFCYQNAKKNIRFVIMNNLIPRKVKLNEKYDLKGSIYKRKASDEELKRDFPTLKDNDFKCFHRHGLVLEPFFYDQLLQTIDDDVRVLRSFGIMDYSLLLAVHNITEEMKTNESSRFLPILTSGDSSIGAHQICNIPTYTQYLRVIEFLRTQQQNFIENEQIETASIQTIKAVLINDDTGENPPLSSCSFFPSTSGLIGGNLWSNRQNLSRLAMAGIPAVNENGDLLLLYVGIIDILQNYRLRKKLEHAFKSTLLTREEISVCNPNHYGDRFVKFISHRVFSKGGAENKETSRSDSQSNTDQVTIHSSKLLNPSSYHSQISDETGSSTTNPSRSLSH